MPLLHLCAFATLCLCACSLLDEFYNRHRRIVPNAVADLDDPRITAHSALITGRYLVKKLRDHGTVSDKGQGLPAGVEVSPFPQGNKLVRNFSEFFSLAVCCPDLFVF